MLTGGVLARLSSSSMLANIGLGREGEGRSTPVPDRLADGSFLKLKCRSIEAVKLSVRPEEVGEKYASRSSTIALIAASYALLPRLLFTEVYEVRSASAGSTISECARGLQTLFLICRRFLWCWHRLARHGFPDNKVRRNVSDGRG